MPNPPTRAFSYAQSGWADKIFLIAWEGMHVLRNSKGNHLRPPSPRVNDISTIEHKCRLMMHLKVYRLRAVAGNATNWLLRLLLVHCLPVDCTITSYPRKKKRKQIPSKKNPRTILFQKQIPCFQFLFWETFLFRETLRTSCSKPRAPFATFRTHRFKRCEE